jgi:hypothetical protein
MNSSGAGIAQSVTGWTAGVWLPAGIRDLYLLHSAQTGSGAHAASYSVGTGGFFPGVKRPGPEADHSPPSSVEDKNDGAIHPLLYTPS